MTPVFLMVSRYESRWAGPSRLQGPPMTVFFEVQTPIGVVAVTSFYRPGLALPPMLRFRCTRPHLRILPPLFEGTDAGEARASRPVFNIQ